jgi:hypothetical protein
MVYLLERTDCKWTLRFVLLHALHALNPGLGAGCFQSTARAIAPPDAAT